MHYLHLILFNITGNVLPGIYIVNTKAYVYANECLHRLILWQKHNWHLNIYIHKLCKTLLTPFLEYYLEKKTHIDI